MGAIILACTKYRKEDRLVRNSPWNIYHSHLPTTPPFSSCTGGKQKTLSQQIAASLALSVIASDY